MQAVAQTSASTSDQSQNSAKNSSATASPSREDRYQLQPGDDPENKLGIPFVKHLATDQEQFFTEPAHFRVKDLRWGVPLMLGTAALIASDSWLAKQVPDKPNQLKRSRDISNYATFSLVGIGGASLFFGEVGRKDHLFETGLLSGEAALNSAADTYLFKEVTQRPRPFEGNGDGKFFQGGDSFPSQHSSIAWSIASVWAHEYPGTLSQTLAYGLASAVTLTRVTSQQHFASDAAIGSLLGWYYGRQVYRAHHDPELGGAAWGDLIPENTGDKTRNPENMGSPYVPVDSWVYPVFDRLAALGYMHSGYEGMRPWTRMECARLVEEIGEKLSSGDESIRDAQKLYNTLVDEFAEETRRLDGSANVGASIDSIYTRSTVISGTPLRDGYHFGQTIINDYGRPYGEGFNNVSGVTAHAVAGPFFISLQGEYQHAPAVASDPLSVLQATASQDVVPFQVGNGMRTVNRFRLLETSAGFSYKNFQFSFGNQSLWLGPGDGGPFLFSNNAGPIPMIRADQVSPIYVNGVSRILGRMRTEFFIGRLSGAQWIFSNGVMYGPTIKDQPFIHGEKISFKPTDNFEFSLGVSTIFGGPGQPVTIHDFLRTFTSAGLASNGEAGTREDPGDRRATADFTYYLPHLRNKMALYADSLVEDEISPIGSSRPSMHTGIYVPAIPGIAKLTLRAESVYTDAPNTVFIGNVYDNGRFLSGYRNNQQIIGSWIGRAGKGGQAWVTYWLSPKESLQCYYRRQVVSREFLNGGGLNDFGIQTKFRLHPNLYLSGQLQYESWMFPVLSTSSQSDLTTSIEISFHPRWKGGN
jgi:membrane-associated phospholipid phosphatase